MALSRREFIETMAAGTAAFAVSSSVGGVGRLFAQQTVVGGNALRMPSLFTGDTLTASKGTTEIWPGFPSPAMMFNGSYPGPTIRVKRGEVFSAQLVNNIDEPLIVHWHGILPPEVMDGHPKRAIAPGETYDYSFKVTQRAGTFFYHPHTHMKTGHQVYMGLAGFFIVDDDEEDKFNLPKGEFEIPILIQDRYFNDNKELVYDHEHGMVNPDSQHMQGMLGDTVVANGTPDAYTTVKPALYRLRLLNGSNSRVYKLAFSDNRPFHIIASDGGLLEQPIEVQNAFFAPGERLDVLVDFSSVAPGSSVMLKSLPWAGETKPRYQGRDMDILRFDIQGEQQTGVIPASLLPFVPIDPTTAARTRVFEFNMKGMDATVNNKIYAMQDVEAEVRFGETEIWEFYNRTNVQHPIHAHGVQFQVIHRSKGNLLPTDMGWKDTTLVMAQERLQVVVRFQEHKGMFLMHCHNLEHEDMGMMANFVISDTVDVADEAQGQQTAFSVAPNPARESTTLRFAESAQRRTLVLTTVDGRTVRSVVVEPGASLLELQLQGLAAGRYFCVFNGVSIPLSVVL